MLHREIDTLRDRNATLELQVIVLCMDICCNLNCWQEFL